MKQITFIICTLIFFILNASNVWALPNCIGTWNPTNWNNCIGSYTWDDGAKYIGEYKNGEKNGQGTHTWTNGDKYFGEWINERRTGQGTYIWANGDIYIGRFKDGKLVGHGTITYTDGNKYIGKYNNGKRHGQGTHTWANGDKYVGEYKNDDRTGQGTYTYADGRKEVGTWENNKLNGYAIKYFADGGIDQEGIFKDDELLYTQTKTLPNCPSSGYFHNCFGTHTYNDGVKYIGEWQNNKKHGQGTHTWASGNKYVGEWQNDKKNGQGTFTWANGDKYVGEWQNAKSHGQGTYTWADGDIYIGEYKNDLMDGRGTYTWSAGDKYVGEWQNDQRHGRGTYIYSTGNKYVGRYKNSKKHGQGTFTWANGDRYVGEYKDGMSNGHGTYTWGSGEWKGDKYVGKFKNDQRHGQGTYTHANGRKEVGEFKNDKLNGYAIKYFADGSIDQEGIFKDDEFIYAEESSPNILNKDNQDNEVINASSGSGFAVSPDGYVITNNHVIEGCQEVILHTKEKDIKTRVIAFDPQNDLALLKGDFQPKTVFALSNNRPELLQDIYVAGYPFGNAISSSIKVTKGIVSSLTGIGNNFSNIQIDAALQSRNSGGPIIDDNGNVIAVAVSKLDAKYMLENFGSIPENTNFGIKSSVVKSILDSNDVARPEANQSGISKTKLGKMISSGTYYISCWMTQAQIELLKSKKVLFEDLN